MIAQPRLRPHPSDGILEVFKRDVDEAAREPLHGEKAQVQRGIAVRREDGAAVFVDSAAAAVEHDHGRMRTRTRRQEQRADDALRADGVPRNAGACHAALKREFGARCIDARRFELNEPGPHDDIVGRRLHLAGHSFSGPDESHRGYAVVTAGYGGLPRDIDAAVVVGHEGCRRSPARPRKRLQRRDCCGLSRGKAAQLDGNHRIDQRDRLVDDDHRGCQCGAHMWTARRSACRKVTPTPDMISLHRKGLAVPRSE
jgi:hypothetical protein